MSLANQVRLYEIFEDGKDSGMAVGGNIYPDLFEDEAEAMGHPSEVLVPLGDTALIAALRAYAND